MDDLLEEAPASSSVLRDLIHLRSRYGITMRKVKEHCPHLRQLAVVRLELARRRLDAGDLHVAAYETVRCAVRQIVPRTDHRRVLWHTLNIDGDLADSLDARRRRVSEELYLSDKAYLRLEEEAYLELAGALVAAVRSPCEDDATPVTVDIQLTLSPERLAYFLNLLSYEPRVDVRDSLGIALLQVLPNARNFLGFNIPVDLEDLRNRDYVLGNEVLDILLDPLLREAWPPHAGNDPLPVLLADSMVLLLRLRTELGMEEHVNVALAESPRWPDKTLTLNDQIMDDFLVTKQVSFLAFALLIRDVEEQDRWGEYLPPPTGARVLVDA